MFRLKSSTFYPMPESAAYVYEFCNFLENDFWTPQPPPPPINFVHGSYLLDMDIIDHVAASLGPLAAALGPESVLTQANPI